MLTAEQIAEVARVKGHEEQIQNWVDELVEELAYADVLRARDYEEVIRIRQSIGDWLVKIGNAGAPAQKKERS